MKLFITFTHLVKLDTLVYSQAINLAKGGGKSCLKKGGVKPGAPQPTA